MYNRHLSSKIVHALDIEPVVVLTGARRVGKSTLMQQMVANGHATKYVTFDSSVEREAARSDPEGYIDSLPEGAVIDEVQRVPNVLLAIKALVDRRPDAGRLLLTGSADVLVLPQIAGALTGRMRRLTLWPLSQGEIDGREETFVARIFDQEMRLSSQNHTGRDGIIERAAIGGFPQLVERDFSDRLSWAEDYVDGLIQRDIIELAGLRRLDDLSRLVRLIATRAPAPLNVADLSRTLGLPVATLKRYLTWLENIYLIRRVPAWYRNIGKRLVKSEKILMIDSGLTASLLASDHQSLSGDRSRLGQLLENFIGMELVKQLGFSSSKARLLHYRDHKGTEVDYVLEDPLGKLVGIEVKAAQSVNAGDFRGLASLRDRVGPDFIRGVLLHCGTGRPVPFGDRLMAAPIDALWT